MVYSKHAKVFLPELERMFGGFEVALESMFVDLSADQPTSITARYLMAVDVAKLASFLHLKVKLTREQYGFLGDIYNFFSGEKTAIVGNHIRMFSKVAELSSIQEPPSTILTLIRKYDIQQDTDLARICKDCFFQILSVTLCSVESPTDEISAIVSEVDDFWTEVLTLSRAERNCYRKESMEFVCKLNAAVTQLIPPLSLVVRQSEYLSNTVHDIEGAIRSMFCQYAEECLLFDSPFAQAKLEVLSDLCPAFMVFGESSTVTEVRKKLIGAKPRFNATVLPALICLLDQYDTAMDTHFGLQSRELVLQLFDLMSYDSSASASEREWVCELSRTFGLSRRAAQSNSSSHFDIQKLTTVLKAGMDELEPALSVLQKNVPQFEGKSNRRIYGTLLLAATGRVALTSKPSTAQLNIVKCIFDTFDVADFEAEASNLAEFLNDEGSNIDSHPGLIDVMEQIDSQAGTAFSKISRVIYAELAKSILLTANELKPEQKSFLDKLTKLTETSAEDETKSMAASTAFDLAAVEPLEDLINELDSLIGLAQIKKEVRELINFLKVQKLRQEKGLTKAPISQHLVFYGNPGTGKTTVARILARIYRALGIVTSGHLVEADRPALVAGFVGQTALKVKEIVERSIGGVLFIDEAYSLCNEMDPYGQEAIDTLIKLMEDHRDNLIVIVAGYNEKMTRFINSNPGLRSRFNKYFSFEDYSPTELAAIFEGFCKKSGFKLSEDGQSTLSALVEKMHGDRGDQFGNGRDVRNLFERTISNQANRIVTLSDIDVNALEELTEADLPKELPKNQI